MVQLNAGLFSSRIGWFILTWVLVSNCPIYTKQGVTYVNILCQNTIGALICICKLCIKLHSMSVL